MVTGEKADAHTLFKLMVITDGQLLIKIYNKLDITFLGLKVPNVGVLIIDDPSQMWDRRHQSKLPGIVGLNLVQMSYNACVKKYVTSGFDSFTCLEGVNLLLSPHYVSTTIQCEDHMLGVTSDAVVHQYDQISPQRQMTCLKKYQKNFSNKTRQIG